MDLRELESFLMLSEELHFGRTAERLRLSQGRVSQLLRSLEERVGGTLVERTSRVVRLTPLGTRFRESLAPAYDALTAAVSATCADARGVTGTLRLGFLGGLSETLTDTIARYTATRPGTRVVPVEVPWTDPFGPIRRGEVDAAVVLLPVREPDLTVGPEFSRAENLLLVSVRHPYARRESIDVAELADVTPVRVAAPAPEYWARHPWPEHLLGPGPRVRTVQEALALVAAGDAAMIMCRPTAECNARRDVAAVPVAGLEESSLGLVWRRDGGTARVLEFAAALGAAGV